MKEFSIRFDALEPRRKKVAIVGFASSTRLKAPFADQGWEVWAMNQLYRFIPRATRWFEIHPHTGPRSWLVDQVQGTDYLKWMAEAPIPIYMVSRHPGIANSVAYPVEQMVAEFKLDEVRPDDDEARKKKGYFHSSVDWMLALAISEGFEEIGIWGVDMVHDTEYGYQKPSGSFWLGLAKGRGIKITLPSDSALLNNEGYRYGYDPLPDNALLTQLQLRAKGLSERRDTVIAEKIALDGGLQENLFWQEYAKQTGRGAKPTQQE